MTKEEYLKRLDGFIDALDRITEKAAPLSVSDAVQMLRLDFEIVTAAYNCTKEENQTKKE